MPACAAAAESGVAGASAYLDARTRNGTFSGVVLIARGSEVIFERAYGDADYESVTPNRIDTRFRIASLTKPLVATAALALAARGRLDLDASICTVLRVCTDAWRPATLRELLSLSSGIPDLFGSVAAVAPAALPDAVDAAVRAATPKSLQLEFVPGSKSEYSNFDYLLLGYALQVRGGASWMDVLQRSVFDPAGMRATQYDDPWPIVPGRARGYRIVSGHLENTKYEDDGALSAGGLLSTARDLNEFIAAYQNDRLIPAALRAQATVPNASAFGYGWQITSFFGARVEDFTGGTNGFSGNISYYPADRLTVVVLSNIENVGAKGIACDLGALMHDKDPRDRSLDFAPVRAASQLSGTYVDATGKLRIFTRDERGLHYAAGSGSPQDLIGDGPNTFALAEHPDVVIDASPDGGSVRSTSCGELLFEAKRR